jgi:hypothetical protein
MNASVSTILSESHSIAARSGVTVKCPFCHHKTFSLKGNDLLRKGFHPACGRFITPNRRDGLSPHSLASVLESIYHDFHRELLALKDVPLSEGLQLLGRRGAISPSPFNQGCQPGTPRSLV